MALPLFLSFLIGLVTFTFSPYSSLCLLFVLFLMKSKKEICSALLLFSLGVLSAFLSTSFKPQGSFEGIGLVTRTGENYFIVLTGRGSCYVSLKEHDVFLLDVIKVQGHCKDLAFNHYEGGFNFREYLNHLNVYGELEKAKVEKVFTSNLDLNSYRGWTTSFFNGQKDFAEAFLFFKATSIESETLNLEKMGLLSVVFSCGIHVSLLLRTMRSIVTKKFGIRKASIAAFLLSLFFLFCSGFSFSGLRIFILSAVWLYSSLSKRKMDSLQASLLSFSILLVLFPFFSLESSFWIPFLLIVFAKLFKPLVNGKNSLVKKAIQLLGRSFVLVPLRLFTKGSYGMLGLLLSPFLISVGSFMFLLLLPCYVFPLWGSFARLPFFLFESLLGFLEGMDFMNLHGRFPFWLLFLWFSLGLLVSIFKSLRFQTLFRMCLASFLPLLLLPTALNYLPKNEIHFIDVGQGSSSLIRYQGRNVLIDTGGSLYRDLAKECLIPYFERIGVRSLDGVLLTHGDLDHDGALESLRKNFKVDRVLYGRDSDDEFVFGGLKFINFNSHPLEEEENESSGVFLFEGKGRKVLFMGDASKKVEKRIVEENPKIQADILVVGHHGSKSSSGFSFLDQVHPSLCVISVGEGNMYGHPHEDVLANLESLNIPYHRTDRQGSLVYRL